MLNERWPQPQVTADLWRGARFSVNAPMLATVFERFKERARQVVVLARAETQTLEHSSLGTEHLLLGLFGQGEGLAARVLAALDITAEGVRARIVEEADAGQAQPAKLIPFTPQAKRALERALRESLSLGHNYIGTEHILLGLVCEDDGLAARILLEFDADCEKVRTLVMRWLSGPGDAQ